MPVATTHAGTGGRVGVTIFFLIWCAIPSVLVVMMARKVIRDAGPWFWKAVDCRIVQSGVAEVGSEGDYAFTVRYAYAAGALSAVEAPTRHGEVYALGYRGGPDYSVPQRLILRYTPGSRATCYVNPSDPDEAVLKREPPWLAMLLPLPLLFIALGLAGLRFTWRGAAAKQGGLASGAPISSGPTTNSARRGAWVAVAFFGVFFVVGAGVTAATGGKALKAIAARSWTPVPATVVSSSVRTHRGEDTTYSVNVLYAYTVDGREYRSNRYGFMGGSSSGYERKRKIVSRYEPGTRFTAYIDPNDPVDAVIERGFTPDMLVVLVPLAFGAVGGIGMYYSARQARGVSAISDATGNGSGLSSSRLAAPPAGRFLRSDGRAPQAGRLTGGRLTASRPSTGAVTLEPRQSRSLKLFGITFVALFWNGIVAVFVYQVGKGWSSGRGEVCLSVFLIPFVGVGVGLMVGVFHSLLALFNPRCTLAMDRIGIALGDDVEFRWNFAGRYDRIERLELRVEGREEATFRQGTDTHTDKNVFHVQSLADTTKAVDVHAGKARWCVPADTMHSFAAANNKVVWVLCVHAHIRGWADVKEEYALAVAPLPAARLASAGELVEGAARAGEAAWS